MYSALAQHLSSTSYQFVLRLYHAGADHLCLASDECLAIYTLDLALVWQYKLQAAVCGLDCFPGHLVVAFADAKVSVLALRNFQLETISMHYYEYSHLRTPSKTTLLASHQSLSVYYFYNSISIIDHASFTTRLVAPSDIHSSLKNIMHFVFLSGYLEPTLAILYQPVLTCTGRLGKDKDTCCLLVVIIDQHFTFPVLYNVQGLPYNCFKLQSVERPLGGLLVFSHNAMIYLDQTSVPGLAMVVNGYFDMETKLISAPPAEGEPPLPTIPHPPSVYVKMNCINDFKSLSISLDGSCAVFVSPDIFLLVLRNGEMYQVDMIGDDHRSWRRKRSGVREFKIRSLGLTMCTPMSIIHLGHQKTAQGRTGRFLCVSNCADSLLVEHSTSIIEAKVEENESDDDLDDDLYGTSKQVQKQGEDGPFMYRVVGSLLCTGPIRDFCLSKPERYTTYPYDNPVDLQVVACAGQDQDGSMVIFSESIRPQILSSFQLAGVENIFSFGYPKSSAHDFIILSKGNRSSILKTGETYEQVEISGFHQTGRTINVGVIGEFIVQAYVGGLQILDKGSFANLDLNVFEEIHFENVKSCSICDPYVLILNEQGDAMLLEVTESARDIANFTDGDIQLSVVFKDRGELRLGSEVVRAAEPVRKSYAGPTTNVDHDDLYADDAIDEDEVDDPIFVDEVEMAKESKYWMFALTKQGTLKVFSLTDLVCRYELNHFDMAMNNSIKEAPETSEIAAGYIYEEMLVATLAQSCYIILRTEKMDIIVYKVTAEPIDDPEQLAVALVRIPNPHISRPPMAFTDTEGDKIHATPTSHHRRSYMSYFEQIGASLNKYEGVMIAGPRPCFLMMAMQGQSVNLRISNPSGSEFILDPIVSAGTHCLRIHPMLIDGNVNSFCPLNTAHSPLGFAYQTHKGEFKICQLPAQFNFDHDWGVCKVNLNRATQKIAYHIASSTHVLATSKPTEFSITRALYAAAGIYVLHSRCRCH